MRPSALSHDTYLATFGPVYEASPWVAEGVWPAGARGELDDLPALAEAMRAIVEAAPGDQRLALIRAHPQLAVAARMAEASVQEQRGAGRDQCSPEELAEFHRLNAAYNERFGHPFIVAEKGLTRADILAALSDRLAYDADTVFATAMA